MNRQITRNAFAALLAAASLGFVATPAPAADLEPTPVVVADYTVFVDPPTGFAFVKLPAGWKFVGQVSAEDIARLPQGVTTALLAAPKTETVASAR